MGNYTFPPTTQHSRFIKYPVDKLLIKQRKCKTQALKQLLPMPDSTGSTSRSCRLGHIVADSLSYFQRKNVRDRTFRPV